VLAQRLEELAQAEVALSQKELAVSGNDLMRELGLPPGPKLGQLLAALLDKVLDEPALNQRPQLVELARAMV
jgi:tRNA nucleotidyltransferase (CCA-adding enzyme)